MEFCKRIKAWYGIWHILVILALGKLRPGPSQEQVLLITESVQILSLVVREYSCKIDLYCVSSGMVHSPRQWVSTFLTMQHFNTVPHAAVTPNHKVISVATSQLYLCLCYES